MKSIHPLLIAMIAAGMPTGTDAATVAATYKFSNNLNAEEGSVPALLPTDPLASNAFVAETVLGQADIVYRFVGSGSPASSQAGLSLNTTGLVTPNSYSLEIVLKFDATSGWRRIMDTRDRGSDSGLYVDPNNHLQIFGSGGTGPNTFTAGYHHVIITVASNGTVKGYIDGLTDFTTSTTEMNLSNSATNTLSLFLDNTSGGGQGEFSSGNIAQFRLHSGVLTDTEALTLSQNPLVPEPSSLALLGLGVSTLFLRRRREVGS